VLTATALAAALVIVFNGGGGSANSMLLNQQRQLMDVNVTATLKSPYKSTTIKKSPKKKIYFVKTHKCASSTVQVLNNNNLCIIYNRFFLLNSILSTTCKY